MGFFSEIDIEIQDMIEEGATPDQVMQAYPMLREDEVTQYFQNDHDGDMDEGEGDEDDGQPSMYEEYQDLYGGDDWDHGQYEIGRAHV